MKYAFINNDVVVAIKDVSDDEIVSESSLFHGCVNIDGVNPAPKVGWVLIGNKLKPDIKPVTPRQIRQALVLAGISEEMILSGLNTLPEPTRSLAKIEWERSTAFDRNRPLVKSMGLMMGFSESQLDDIWLLAMSLS